MPSRRTGGAPSEPSSERVYGRRKGRPLRPGQRDLCERLLPRLAVAMPPPGESLQPATLFERPLREIWLEIGFGGGEHLAAQAAAHPDVGILGAEVFINGVARLLRAIDQIGLANVRIHHGDARALLAALPPASVARTFVLFPDPWPKSRHRKRRLIRPASLDRLAEILADGGELRLATDDAGYLTWMLECLGRHPDFRWLARRPADWRVRPADWPPTRYEEKALAAGRRPAYLRWRRRPRGGRGGG